MIVLGMLLWQYDSCSNRIYSHVPASNDVLIRDVSTIAPAKATAFDTTARAKIFDMLAEDKMPIEELTDEFARRGDGERAEQFS
jgi:hypothetical protein